MKKQYFAVVWTFICPNQKCRKPAMGVAYFAVFNPAEIGEANRKGLVTYVCDKCGTSFRSDSLRPEIDPQPTSESEAISNGLAFDSESGTPKHI
jgi:hypothetical protein